MDKTASLKKNMVGGNKGIIIVVRQSSTPTSQTGISSLAPSGRFGILFLLRLFGYGGQVRLRFRFGGFPPNPLSLFGEVGIFLTLT